MVSQIIGLDQQSTDKLEERLPRTSLGNCRSCGSLFNDKGNAISATFNNISPPVDLQKLTS